MRDQKVDTSRVETTAPHVWTAALVVETRGRLLEGRVSRAGTGARDIETCAPRVECGAPDVETDAQVIETRAPDSGGGLPHEEAGVLPLWRECLSLE